MDIYAEITNRMIAEMEQGIIPWRKPWMAAGRAISHTTGKAYSLLNQMLLGRPGEYLTFNQCQQEGGHIRKGEKARIVVFWKWLEKKDEETEEVTQVPYLRYYNVFHIDQCEGVAIEHRAGDSAFYQPATDRIVLPLLAQFAETAEYYGTAFHEMVHSTGHAKRLARLDTTANFGGEEYSKEELIAEIGSAALVHHAGLETASSFRNSTAYVQNWLQVLKDDKRFIVSAAGKADKAVNYILAGA